MTIQSTTSNAIIITTAYCSQGITPLYTSPELASVSVT